MNDELDKQLCENFPKMFKDRRGRTHEADTCWGFEHGDGWFNIIWALCSNIQGHIDAQEKLRQEAIRFNHMRADMLDGDFTAFELKYGSTYDDEFVQIRRKQIMEENPWVVRNQVEQVVVEQVKEKFGSLRFYYRGGDDAIDGMVRMAESMSVVTCEVCGNAGKIRRNGWLRSLCDKHASKK